MCEKWNIEYRYFLNIDIYRKHMSLSLSLHNEKNCCENSGSTAREFFGFELGVLERVSSRKNISVPRHAK
jgi:hypothetical protein